MNGDDLRLAPAGASDAACAVCLHMTFNRIVVGDGHAPICSTFCLQAWPRVRDLIADRDEWRRQHENALACAAADQRALLRVSRAAKAFRDWDAIGALLSGDEPHAEDAQNDLRELDAALSRAESAELGCEIAYRRDPTQAEGDAHELPRGEGAIRECHVPMGNHHGHRCLCGIWVWGGPTVCQRCVGAEAVKAALLRVNSPFIAARWLEVHAILHDGPHKESVVAALEANMAELWSCLTEADQEAVQKVVQLRIKDIWETPTVPNAVVAKSPRGYETEGF